MNVQITQIIRASICCLLLILATSCSQESAEKSATASPKAAKVTATSKATTEALTNRRIPAKVVRVVDGDTMKVSYTEGGKVREETIRLLLVDTPESVDPEKPVQPFAIEASNYAKKMLTDKDVQLELDVSERDKYGRLLCYLYIGDKMFNELLLENGYARVAYVYPPNVKYVDQFRDIQKKAQQKGVNIWSVENYAQEDGFHEGAASGKPSPSATAVAKSGAAATAAPKAGVSYNSCAEARAAGVSQIRRGEPGYSAKLDGDNDGVACE
ncbi:thermonuclease family protein [Paenibacillus roseipurpureus]|uniref:Thermonuclease family protein n=1 Tax=Paenibacillus roseopurpureus TaxID=2918901 RepID=A0AA96RN03_9BACL|nr:thermonuclease family protein [Paenibacillus sp. MBLB1832]WNR44872.1 thermonuclease family protein [Paenibacillus sp. MBLB1832]